MTDPIMSDLGTAHASAIAAQAHHIKLLKKELEMERLNVDRAISGWKRTQDELAIARDLASRHYADFVDQMSALRNLLREAVEFMPDLIADTGDDGLDAERWTGKARAMLECRADAKEILKLAPRATMKRFLVFSGAIYSGIGGWDDFNAAFDALDEAEGYCEQKLADGAKSHYPEWISIVDLESLSVVWEK